MTSAYPCSMSRRDYLARLLIGAPSTVAPPKRKASFPRDVATEFTALPGRQGHRIVFPHSCPFAHLRCLWLCSLRFLLFSLKSRSFALSPFRHVTFSPQPVDFTIFTPDFMRRQRTLR